MFSRRCLGECEPQSLCPLCEFNPAYRHFPSAPGCFKQPFNTHYWTAFRANITNDEQTQHKFISPKPLASPLKITLSADNTFTCNCYSFTFLSFFLSLSSIHSFIFSFIVYFFSVPSLFHKLCCAKFTDKVVCAFRAI